MDGETGVFNRELREGVESTRYSLLATDFLTANVAKTREFQNLEVTRFYLRIFATFAV